MSLTKEQAIEGHRKMWNWIADKIEEITEVRDIDTYKFCYCTENELDLLNLCFCCEYSCRPYDANCGKCPLEWESNLKGYMCTDKNKEDDYEGLYSLCTQAKTWQEQVELARKIANLPAREEV